MIKFQDFDSFIQTIDFLNCASQADYDSWRSQIQIMTVAKQKEQFVSQLLNGMTDDKIDDILLDYVGQIERNTSDDGFTSFKTNFFSHTQFRNLEGVFLIGDRILAEYKDARISIMNGDWSVLDEIKNDAEFPENYQSYTDLENVLIERHDLFVCCDELNKKTHTYDNGDKRIISEYKWIDVTEMNFIPQSGWFVFPIVNWKQKYKSEKRRSPATLGWKNHQRHWTFIHDAVNRVLPDEPEFETNNNVIYDVVNDLWTSSVTGDSEYRFTTRGPYPVPEGGGVCVYSTNWEVNLHQTLNGPVEESMSLSCTPDLSVICDECPEGWTYNNGSCYSGICAEGAWIWGNGMWYPSVNGQCSQGTYNSSTGQCYIGWFPNGYGDPFVWGDCFWIEAGCPWN